MQGEGQEFESPRLHHLRSLAALQIEEPRANPGNRPVSTAYAAARTAGGSSSIEPLLRALHVLEVTDQRIAGATHDLGRVERRLASASRTLTTG